MPDHLPPNREPDHRFGFLRCHNQNIVPAAALHDVAKYGGAGAARYRQESSFQQISPYSHHISGGKATVAKMFVNNANGQRGLVCHYDVVCFDEVSGISFDQKDGVNIMKGYMALGEFSRG